MVMYSMHIFRVGPLEVLLTLQFLPQHLHICVINLVKASDKLSHFLLHWIYLEKTKIVENEEAV